MRKLLIAVLLAACGPTQTAPSTTTSPPPPPDNTGGEPGPGDPEGGSCVAVYSHCGCAWTCVEEAPDVDCARACLEPQPPQPSCEWGDGGCQIAD